MAKAPCETHICGFTCASLFYPLSNAEHGCYEIFKAPFILRQEHLTTKKAGWSLLLFLYFFPVWLRLSWVIPEKEE